MAVAGARLVSSARPPERASELEAARRRGASRRAVLALARRRLLRLARRRHWVGVPRQRAGSSGSRRPHPTLRGGAGALAHGPSGPVGTRPSLRRWGLRPARARPAPPLKPRARAAAGLPRPPLPRRPLGSSVLASGNPAFPGRGLVAARCRGSAPRPPLVCGAQTESQTEAAVGPQRLYDCSPGPRPTTLGIPSPKPAKGAV